MIQSKAENQIFLQIILGIIKFIFFTITILSFIGIQSILMFVIPDKYKYFYSARIVSYFSKLSLKILKINYTSNDLNKIPKTGLIVSNHQSYIDVLLLAALFPSLFVTSVEIKETFLLGKITQLAGCFFVERRKHKIRPGTKEKEINEIKQVMSHGHHIVLFPEGTSTDGKNVLPFKATFFQVAVECECSVIPIVIKYLEDGKEVVPWYGSMTFFDHLFKLCLLDNISAELILLPSIEGDNKFTLANKSFEAISENYEKH